MAQDYLTVSVLTKYLKRKFDADPYLERVYLTGEISNFRLRPNHQYFSLKDEHAKISAVMFKGAFSKLKFRPEEGMKVLVVGHISIFEATGNYQIYIEQMQPDGVGALYQAYEQLKEKLDKEGIFRAPKKILPRYPKKIAVVTSPSGAVIRDIITTVRRRFPIAQVVLFPTVVQGNKAADDVVRNIQRIEAIGDFDTIIIGRGGGSIEDLWPFNEERVARAIFQAQTPIISSVGHETDTTIADLVADLRAPTPTAAAELATPVLTDEILKITQQRLRLLQAVKMIIQRDQQLVQRQTGSYIFKTPARLYEGYLQKLDFLNTKLLAEFRQQLSDKQRRYLQANGRLKTSDPRPQIKYAKATVLNEHKLLVKSMSQYLVKRQNLLAQTAAQLNALSPLSIMGRGYSYVSQTGKIMRTVHDLHVDDEIEIHLADGVAKAQVTALKEEKTNE